MNTVSQFYEYFGDKMMLIEQSEDDVLITTMVACPAGLDIHWTACDINKDGITISSSKVAKNISELINCNQEVIMLYLLNEINNISV